MHQVGEVRRQHVSSEDVIIFPKELERQEGPMPRVTAFNLRKDDPLSEIEGAMRRALTSQPALEINDQEIDLVPVYEPDDFPTAVTRVDVDLWEHPARTKDALQDLAEEVAHAFRSFVGRDRKVKVVIRPYDVHRSGCVSF